MAFNLLDIEDRIETSTIKVEIAAERFKNFSYDLPVDTVANDLQYHNEYFRTTTTTLIGELRLLKDTLQEKSTAAEAKEKEYNSKLAQLEKMLQAGVTNSVSVEGVRNAVQNLDIGGVHEKLDKIIQAMQAGAGVADPASVEAAREK